MRFKFLPVAAACAAALLAITGCGGSGSSSVVSAPAAPPVLSGTAATGAAFDGADITITDRTGTVVGSATSLADGSYSATLAEGASGPFVLQAVRDDQTLVSVAPEAGGTINITPITHLIAARLATSGDPARLAGEFQANPDQLTGATITAKVEEVVAALKPLLDAVGADANPLTGSFTANGEGADRALDSLAISIVPGSASSSNIEVTIKQVLADGDAPPTIQFSSAAATLPALPAVAAANLVKPGTAPLIADLLARMNACFALPAADRVDVPDASNQVASNIKAAACKDIFHNGDPATFKSNGRLVGSNANTDAFANIFRSRGDNLVFDRGTYEFSRANGDIVIGYRSRDAAGNATNDVFAVRPDNVAAPTRLGQIGNQYDYEGGVRPYHQLRSFVNQPASDYYSTGYAFSVVNMLTAGSTPLFARVVVTSPRGGTLTLKPKTGFTLLQLVKGPLPADITGSSFIRLLSQYLSPAKAGENPATADTKLFFAATPSSDAEIEGFGQKGVWKFDYYLASAPTAIAATQSYRTRARALSIGELKQQAMAELSSATLADLADQSSALGHLAMPATGYPLSWTVGVNALAPTSLAVWGFAGGSSPVGFNDSLVVGSTARSAAVPCVKKSGPDLHCTGTAVNVPSNYAAGNRLNGMHLFARDAVGREFAHFYATYAIGSGEE